MKCPHCLVEFHDDGRWLSADTATGSDHQARILSVRCPACKRVTVKLHRPLDFATMVHPKGISRTPLSAEIPEDYTSDYKEACLVFSDSPKASAALSRRCLQHLIREHFKIKEKTLDGEIQKLLDSRVLPTHISEAVDAVRVVGNFAAHPLKSTNSREVLPVEDGEAEWLLDTLEALFDFCFVQPAALKTKRDALNKKLTDAGKPPLK